MRKYTIKFELFGKKMRWECEAADEAHAKSQLKEFLYKKVTFDEIISEPAPKRKPVNINDIFDNFADIFDKDFPFKFGK